MQLQDPGRALSCERSMPMSENLHNINIFEVNYSVKTHNCQVAEDAIYLEGYQSESRWDCRLKYFPLEVGRLSSEPSLSLSSWAWSRHPTGEVKFKLLGFQYSHHTVFGYGIDLRQKSSLWPGRNWGRDE